MATFCDICIENGLGNWEGEYACGSCGVDLCADCKKEGESGDTFCFSGGCDLSIDEQRRL